MSEYKELKVRLTEIIQSKTKIEEKKSIPKRDQEFTYENGIKAWVGAIFIDIVDSSSLFKNQKQETVARVIRAFSDGIINILKSNDKYRQIGIRGDSVFGIYSTDYQKDVLELLNVAADCNSFLKLLNSVLVKNNFPSIRAGIGLGLSQDLIIKVGKSGTGINDMVWIGDSVVDAANFSSVANRKGRNQIVMSKLFYNNMIDLQIKVNENSKNWFKEIYISEFNQNAYGCNLYYTSVNKYL